ncbi:DNA-binding transcriptional regulator, FadR family [Mucilaginibacter lappiensis]|uniref:DNA-binding FadR family transcriptional regulator n=1 Tax=Mucilaginibacter lappiensis TaxID=354630 RepID=A0ABR6PCV5_9SPHI|nr:FadR/GntR family transcriptional regulator [Mucilaginibacter lappiensis]MBB6107574.1 DNA-binding FadR family transcriptional regulator [Mucilaginibacter lappiensis]SIQ03934.1 DNA-binding transcriptional regulator, FadR family [Mucilaginibacter lappiensis]
MKLYNKILSQIKEDINKEKYKPGEKIPTEPELMKIYNVGRSTIREAIKTLAISGILNVKQGAGTFINANFQNVSMEQRLRRADFDEINDVRALLEKEIVKRATLNHTEDQIIKIEQALQNRKIAIQAEKPQECVDADIEFHMAIANAAGNIVLSELYYSFTLILRNFFSARDAQGISYFAMNHHLHEQLYKAIRSKRINQSQSVLQKILDNNY